VQRGVVDSTMYPTFVSEILPWWNWTPPSLPPHTSITWLCY